MHHYIWKLELVWDILWVIEAFGEKAVFFHLASNTRINRLLIFSVEWTFAKFDVLKRRTSKQIIEGLSVPKIDQTRKMIIINTSCEAILRSTFSSFELKNVRGLPIKLYLALFKWSYNFYWLSVRQYSFYNKNIYNKNIFLEIYICIFW